MISMNLEEILMDSLVVLKSLFQWYALSIFKIHEFDVKLAKTAVFIWFNVCRMLFSNMKTSIAYLNCLPRKQFRCQELTTGKLKDITIGKLFIL